MGLLQEIEQKAKEIHTDGYSMSVGELMTLYKNDELDIHPEFQRFYRWNDLQKSKLIESILLGIPVPSIFVSQRESGVWDVIDGLQRLSTIFQFAGILKDEHKNLLKPNRLSATSFLPSLEGKLWESGNEEESFTNSERLIIKRYRIDIKIIKKESDIDTKYELFQRLNTGGTALSNQEVRNCIMVMINRDFFYWLKSLSDYPAFKDCVPLTERALRQQDDLELVLRYFALKNCTQEEIDNLNDVGDFLTKFMIEFCNKPSFNRDVESSNFKKTFNILERTLGEDAFKKYILGKDRFQGSFSIAAFEAIAVGLGHNIDEYNEDLESIGAIKEKVKRIWNEQIFMQNSGSGIRANSRLPRLLPFGKDLFKQTKELKEIGSV